MPAKHSRELLFEKLFNDNQSRFGWIAKSYASYNEQQDLLQEIWHQVWRSLGNYKSQAELNTWAYRVALNTAITYVRKDSKQPKSVELELINESATFGCTSEVMQLVESFIEQLAPLDKAVFLMYLEGFSQQETAEVLALSASNVGVKISRLKQKFEQDYVE